MTPRIFLAQLWTLVALVPFYWVRGKLTGKPSPFVENDR